MAVTKRQGREKLAQTEQSKVKGRSEDRSEDFRWNKQPSWLSPICTEQAQGEENTYKKRSQRARFHCPPPPGTGALFSSRLWLNMPSHLEDGFSCYYLNKIEL